MKHVFLVLLGLLIVVSLNAQINGKIISEENGVTVLKVWGTHAERGYAQGYFLADQIVDIWSNYFKHGHYANNYKDAKNVLTADKNFKIPNEYVVEAKYVMKGVKDAGVDITGLNEWDLLLMCSFLDVDGLLKAQKKAEGPGCSTLISWNEATLGTSLNGKSIATRHTDWGAYKGIIDNDVIVIHIPSEDDEQPWTNVGYAGMIAPLSAMNEGGLGAFGQIMLSSGSDHGQAQTELEYEPWWFTIRKAVEKKDYNGDGANDVLDMLDAALSNPMGYADGFIFASVAKSTSNDNNKIAMIGELAPTEPFVTSRTSAFEDKIPGDNLYSANDQIARNNNLDYCVRYNSVIEYIGSGKKFDAQAQWDFMKLYSNSWLKFKWDNIQMMQFIPEDQTLKYAGYTDTLQAYQAPFIVLNLDTIYPSKDKAEITILK